MGGGKGGVGSGESPIFSSMVVVIDTTFPPSVGDGHVRSPPVPPLGRLGVHGTPVAGRHPGRHWNRRCHERAGETRAALGGVPLGREALQLARLWALRVGGAAERAAGGGGEAGRTTRRCAAARAGRR